MFSMDGFIRTEWKEVICRTKFKVRVLEEASHHCQ